MKKKMLAMLLAAVMTLSLAACGSGNSGMSKEELLEFCEAYVALVGEFGDHRTGVAQFVRDTEKLTGIDVKKLLDEAVERC